MDEEKGTFLQKSSFTQHNKKQFHHLTLKKTSMQHYAVEKYVL